MNRPSLLDCLLGRCVKTAVARNEKAYQELEKKLQNGAAEGVEEIARLLRGERGDAESSS